MDLFGTHTTLDRLELKPGQRILEIGAGRGRLLIPAAKRVLPGGEAVALDIRQHAIDTLLRLARKAQLSNVSARVGDATQAHFPAGSFDLVYITAALGEMSDPQAVLRQSYRVLKPGGRLSITEMILDPHYQALDKVEAMAGSLGFRRAHILGGWAFYTAHFVKARKQS